MTVDLEVSRELLKEVSRGEFARYLDLFHATVVGERPAGNPFSVIFALDVPDAPKGAARVMPIFRNDGENGNVSVSLVGLDWWDAAGRRIHTEA